MPNTFDWFSSFVLQWNEKIRMNVAESRTLSALRDTLLPKLISGEMRVGESKSVLDRNALNARLDGRSGEKK